MFNYGEKALKVFVGDQELFKVGVYEKQVLIKPITDELDARTNLVIVTDSGRLTFDVSVGGPETADFVVDFRLPEEDEALVQNAFQQKVDQKTKELEKDYKAKEEKLGETAQTLSDEKFKSQMAAGITTLPLKASAVKDKVQLNLLSLSRSQHKAYLRFSILNSARHGNKADSRNEEDRRQRGQVARGVGRGAGDERGQDAHGEPQQQEGVGRPPPTRQTDDQADDEEDGRDDVEHRPAGDVVGQELVAAAGPDEGQ